MKIDIFTDSFGIEMVTIDNENGTFTSMLKSTYDEMIVAQANKPAL